jgi:diguanylate cyclase (GGDEF)-like protein/PAS domain S-box-containing protein
MKGHTKMTRTELAQLLDSLGPFAASKSPRTDMHRLIRELQAQRNDLAARNRSMQEAQHLLEESRDRYAHLYDFAPLGYVTLNKLGVIQDINMTAAGMFGAERSRFVGLPFALHIDKCDARHFYNHLRRCREAGEASATELHLLRKDRSRLPVQLHSMLAPESAHDQAEYRVTITDISERKHAEQALRLAANVFENCGEAIVVCDGDTNVISVNRAFCTITGYAEAEVIGDNAKQLDIWFRDASCEQALWSLVGQEGYWQGDAWGRRKDNSLFAQWLTITTVSDERGGISHYIGIFSDITERKTAAERILYMAHHDPLTDLPNRALLHDRLALAIAGAQRNNNGVAVLFFDIDLFKSVNDSLGHAVGDQLLRQIAARMTQCLRLGDTVSRRGGDEFIVVMGDVRGTDELMHAVEKILRSIRQPYIIDGLELNVTASIGISLYPQDGCDVETLIQHADVAMYFAKDNGRNNYQFYIPALNADASQRLALESSLHRALERSEFTLHYQPQVHAASGRIRGCEALIRWQHPEQGLVAPDRFIPVAEKCGLINAIGDWVLRTACQQNRQWQTTGLASIPVAVNLSGIQLRQKDFLKNVAQILREGELDPRYLAIELTESTLLQNVDGAGACLQRLKSMGLQIVLDDFGTGYSSLGYLKRFPVDKLKIDKSFMLDVPVGSNDITLIRTIINMGHNLNIGVIAEGVETRAQFDFLRAQRCEEMQGDFCGQPMPAADFANLLRARGRLNS